MTLCNSCVNCSCLSDLKYGTWKTSSLIFGDFSFSGLGTTSEISKFHSFLFVSRNSTLDSYIWNLDLYLYLYFIYIYSIKHELGKKGKLVILISKVNFFKSYQNKFNFFWNTKLKNNSELYIVLEMNIFKNMFQL